jgi:hypothetical protein
MSLSSIQEKIFSLSWEPALILLAAVVGAEATAAQTPELARIVARHVTAIGGQKRLDSIQSFQMSAIVNERGTLHPLFIDRRRPNLLRVRMMHGGDLVFTEVYTGTGSWEGAPGKENCAPDSGARNATRRAAEEFDDPLLAALSHDATAQLKGRVRLGGQDLYQIDVTQTDGNQGSYFLDSHSFLLNRVRNHRPMHPGEPSRLVELVLDDYRPLSGVLFAFRSIERDVETGEPLTVGLLLWGEANVPVTGDPYAIPATCH